MYSNCFISQQKYDELLIEDLKSQPQEEKIKLDIKDVREYFAAQKLDFGQDIEMEDSQEVNDYACV